MSLESSLPRRLGKKPDVGPDRKYVRAALPWAVALGAFVFYLATLNHWVSVGNLLQVAKVSGYSWQPELYAPLTWLVTLPLKLLPARLVPLGLNLFAAVCASLTLALLARSIAIWPHDKTHDQREKQLGPFGFLSIPTAWLPPLLGTLVCAWQLTFWENATSANTAAPLEAGCEMLDLLLIAYIIRCLLEFRLEQRESWLLRATFVYGLGITTNWAMIGFFPIFLAALIWLQGLNFFNVRFLVRIFLLGLVGLSLYLLLPVVQSKPFWSALKDNLMAQKEVLKFVYRLFANGQDGKQEALLFALTSWIPLLLISIKWASYFGDTSKLGVALTNLVMHFVHGLFLMVCLWVVLDPPFSPRSKTLGLPLLTLTYFAALSIGYFAGYFLLLFRPKPAEQRRREGLRHLVNLALTCAIWLLTILTPATLLFKNLPQMRVTNGPIMRNFASFLAENISDRSIVLSDNIRRLFLLQMIGSQRPGAENLFLDTTSLPIAEYHRYLKRHYGQRWPIDPDKNTRMVDPLTLQGLLITLATTNQLFYLHPSFGYYFEAFCVEQAGPVSKLTRYPTNSLIAPLPTTEQKEQNATVWAKGQESVLGPIAAALRPENLAPKSGFFRKVLKIARVNSEANRDMRVVGAWVSQALDYWGVQLQRSGGLAEASKFFERAAEMNPENVVVKVNLECNRNLRAGRKPTVEFQRSVEDEFGRFRSWDTILNEDGPFDEATFCFKQGLTFAGQSLYRQAATEFNRAHELAPENLYAGLWLAQLYVLGHMPDQALGVIAQIHANPGGRVVPRTNATELLYVEMSAYLAKQDPPGADQAAARVLERHPADEELIMSAAQVFINFGAFSNALPWIDRQLKIMPKDPDALFNKGVASLQTGALDDAITALNQVLDVNTNTPLHPDLHDSALLSRAIAYLKAEKLEEAQRDYETLQKSYPTLFRIYYGLGEIAFRKRDTNAAIRNYRLYLTNSPTNPDEIKAVNERLKALQPAAN